MTSIEFTTLDTVRSKIKCLPDIGKSLRMIEKYLHAQVRLKSLELRAKHPDLEMFIDAVEAEMEKTPVEDVQ